MLSSAEIIPFCKFLLLLEKCFMSTCTMWLSILDILTLVSGVQCRGIWATGRHWPWTSFFLLDHLSHCLWYKSHFSQWLIMTAINNEQQRRYSLCERYKVSACWLLSETFWDQMSDYTVADSTDNSLNSIHNGMFLLTIIWEIYWISSSLLKMSANIFCLVSVPHIPYTAAFRKLKKKNTLIINLFS